MAQFRNGYITRDRAEVEAANLDASFPGCLLEWQNAVNEAERIAGKTLVKDTSDIPVVASGFMGTGAVAGGASPVASRTSGYSTGMIPGHKPMPPAGPRLRAVDPMGMLTPN
jgi:hypothetical protein